MEETQLLEFILSDSESSESDDPGDENLAALAHMVINAYMRVRRTLQTSDPLAFWGISKKCTTLSVLVKTILCPLSRSAT